MEGVKEGAERRDSEVVRKGEKYVRGEAGERKGKELGGRKVEKREEQEAGRQAGGTRKAGREESGGGREGREGGWRGRGRGRGLSGLKTSEPRNSRREP